MDIKVKDQHTVEEDHKGFSWQRELKAYANGFSFAFHPLFIPTYLVAFVVYLTPYAFAGMDNKTKIFRLISVFMLTAFFPAFTVFLLWRLKFISSVLLKTQKERIIPYVAAMFFYFWLYYVSINIVVDCPPFLWITLGTFLSSIAALMANIYCKISMHAIAMGSMFLFFILLGLSGDAFVGPIMNFTLLVGIVLSSRLLVSDHTSFEVYCGFFLGILCQYIAFLVV